MKLPHRGEVWLVDLGLAAKIRPCLVVGAPAAGDDRVIATLMPHTTSLRGTQFEISVPVPFLRAGAFDAQGIVTVPAVRLMRLMGTLRPEQMNAVHGGICL